MDRPSAFTTTRTQIETTYYPITDKSFKYCEFQHLSCLLYSSSFLHICVIKVHPVKSGSIFFRFIQIQIQNQKLRLSTTTTWIHWRYLISSPKHHPTEKYQTLCQVLMLFITSLLRKLQEDN